MSLEQDSYRQSSVLAHARELLADARLVTVVDTFQQGVQSDARPEDKTAECRMVSCPGKTHAASQGTEVASSSVAVSSAVMSSPLLECMLGILLLL